MLPGRLLSRLPRIASQNACNGTAGPIALWFCPRRALQAQHSRGCPAAATHAAGLESAPAAEQVASGQRRIELICSDVDGTLMNSRNQLSPAVEEAVNAAAAAGVPVRTRTRLGQGCAAWLAAGRQAAGARKSQCQAFAAQVMHPAAWLLAAAACGGDGQGYGAVGGGTPPPQLPPPPDLPSGGLVGWYVSAYSPVWGWTAVAALGGVQSGRAAAAVECASTGAGLQGLACAAALY